MRARQDARTSLSVLAFFVANGLAVGTFGGSLPGLQQLLDLGTGTITAMLVVAGAAAILGMNLSGPAADRVGVRAPLLVSSALLLAGLVAISSAGPRWGLFAGVAVFGLGNGGLDVSMNALGVWVERRRGRSVMSRLHAGFSAGGLIGGLLVVVLGRVVTGSAEPRVPLGVTAALFVALVVVGGLLVPSATPAPAETADGVRPREGRGVPRLAWLLAVMALCFGLTEGTAVDWSSLHVREVGRVSASAAAWGLTAVSGLMMAVRLVGDVVVDRLGAATVIRVGCAIALVGYLVTALTSPLPWILLGWSLVGLGVGLIAPQVYGMAGHLAGGRGLALVVSFGYTAFLLGPGLIGFTARHSDLQRAMFVPVATAVLLILLASRLRATAH